MNITVLGWYGNCNCGDESYKIAFPLIFPDHNFTFISSCYHIPENTDLLFVGGGDILKKNFISNLPNNIRKIAISNTVTEEADFDNFHIFEKIFVRDYSSLDLALTYNKNTYYLPDLSFALTPNRENGRNLLQANAFKNNHKLTKRIVGVVINGYISYNFDGALARDVNAFDKMNHELSRLCESMDSSWVYIPFSTKPPWDDVSTNSWICSRSKKKFYKNINIVDKLSVQNTLDMIAACDVVISTRFHSTLFSVISGVPFFDILHHHKNLNFINHINKLEWSSWLWNLDHDKMANHVKCCLNSNMYKKELSIFAEKSKKELYNAAKYIL